MQSGTIKTNFMFGMDLMKKLLLLFLLLSSLTLSACQNSNNRAPKSHGNQTTKNYHAVKTKVPAISIHHKFKGFKLATVPAEFCGTWYRADPFSKKARRLVISSHKVNGDITYQKVDPNLKLDHNSIKQNKKYVGNICLISLQNNSLKVRGFLDTVDLIYKTGSFRNYPCLLMSYGTNSQAVNGVIFKERKIAIKYRKYDFSKIKEQ